MSDASLPPSDDDCAHTRSVRALLLAVAAGMLVVAPNTLWALVDLPAHAAGIGLSAALVVAALAHQATRMWTRLLASVAFGAWLVASLYDAIDAPGRGLFLLLEAVLFYAMLWPSDALRRKAITEGRIPEDHGAWVTAFVACLVGFHAWQHAEPASLPLAGVLALPIAVAAQRRLFQSVWEKLGLATAALLALLPAVAVAWPVLPYAIGLLAPLFLMLLLLQRMFRQDLRGALDDPDRQWLDVILARPSRVVVVSFVALCALGTLLLTLPMSAPANTGLSWLDAAFTAVSATCVTGLIVVDTPTAFTGLGQLIVLGLIQVGGLGIMVFSAAAIVLLGQRMSLQHESAAVDLLQAPGRAGLVQAVRNVVLVTFVTEGAAATLLAIRFLIGGDSVPMAIWRGTFTAVSAFCNAGFALQSDSLIPYADSPFVLAVTGVTIVVGGLGPAVVVTLTHYRTAWRRSLHARLVVWTTALLIVLPALLITIVEWDGAMAGLSWVDKLSNGLFQSITLRTAGFNSIDLTLINPATWTLMVMVMFVGGSPGSTAGGAKTTTMAVLVLTMLAIVRGRDRVTVLGRTIPQGAILRAVAVSLLGVFGVAIALAALLLTLPMPLDVALFEVVSALATVGLSIGGTARLDEVGKALIIACMFVGRVGPLTLLVFLSSTDREPDHRRYPEQPVAIG